MTSRFTILQRLKIIRTRLFHWEYWNSSMLYLPVMPYQVFLFIKARAVFFFNAANPGIKNGGLMMESKWEIYKDAPENFFPKSLYVQGDEHFDEIVLTASKSFTFPLIAKPDIGSKGRGVAIIKSEHELQQYHNTCPVPYLIQEKIDLPKEAGIFYMRMPSEKKGRITGIVEKIFVQVTGDGRHTIYELLQQNPRYLLQISALEKIIEPQVLCHILPADKTRILMDIGNHARGACFVNASHRINERLEQAMDEYCRRFPGFYFGRLDIRFSSWEALEQGRDFAVIELNGSGSEPTHIYDPANSLWYVWKEICRHWNWLYKIAKYNQQVNKHPYQTFTEAVRLVQENNNYSKKLKGFLFSPVPDKTMDNENDQPIH